MNDEETVALIAGGHTFGKCHGADDAATYGPEPEGASIEEQGLGWKNSLGTGNAQYTITSGIEGAWTPDPRPVGQRLLRHAVRLRVGVREGPGRRLAVAPDRQVRARTGAGRARAGQEASADDADHGHRAGKVDPSYEAISKRFHENPEELADAFARAWFKLTHRDMGPKSRYLGPEVPDEDLIWQDPVPAVDHELIDEERVAAAEEADPRPRLPGPRAGQDRLGVRVDLPRVRQARRRQRRAPPPGPAEGLGGQPARAALQGAGRAGRRAEGFQRRPERQQTGVSRRPDRAGGLRRRRGGGEEGRP